MFLRLVVCLAFLLVLLVEAEDQAWSEHTYLDVSYTLSCNDTENNQTYSFYDGDKGKWRRLGSDQELKTNDRYELIHGNLELVIRNVTDDVAGIYICEVFDSNGVLVSNYPTVKGLNLDEHLYHDLLDKYKTSIYRGLITAACVIGLVVGVCLVDRFRYLTDEQKQQRKNGKLVRQQRQSQPQSQPQHGGRDNVGMADDLDVPETTNYGSVKSTEGNTRF